MAEDGSVQQDGRIEIAEWQNVSKLRQEQKME